MSDTTLHWLNEALSAENQSGKADIVEQYQAAIAVRFGARYAVAMSSGSAAIESTLMACGAKLGSKVIVSAAAPLPTIMPILGAGCVPLFVDTNAQNVAINADDCAKVIDASVIAAIEVPLWGYPFDSGPLRAILDRYSIPLLYDASHAHGALGPDGAQVGTDGLAACFSTHDRKLLRTGEGGFVTTNDPELADRIRRFTRLQNLDGVSFGRNYKTCGVVAAVGLSRLQTFDQVLARRSAAMSLIRDGLGGPWTEYPIYGNPNGYNFVVTLPDEPGKVELFRSMANAAGLEVDGVRYGYDVAYRRTIVRDFKRHCPRAESLVPRLVQISTRDADYEESVNSARDVLWQVWKGR